MHNFSTNTLISVVGPTGSGKSDLAIQIARGLDAQTPIISTDSRQVYKGMAIGTAQPTENQLLAAPHYFIADRPTTERFTCADFEKEALELLKNLFAQTKAVIAVGGSGLYVDALTRGLDELPDVDPEIRKQLNSNTLEELTKELREKDPVYFEQVDRANRVRVQRAVEVIRQMGRPFSEFRKSDAKARAQVCDSGIERDEAGGETHRSRPFRTLTIVLDPPREELYERIDTRVEKMIEAGLEDEARALRRYSQLPALQTVGYRELNQYFNGEISFERAVELVKRNSRRYAKRQLTWFRHRNPPTAADTFYIHRFGDDPKALTEASAELKINRSATGA